MGLGQRGVPPRRVGGDAVSLAACAAVFCLAVAPSALVVAQTADGAYTGAALLTDLRYCDGAPADYRCGRGATYIKGIVRRLAGRMGEPGPGKGHNAFCIGADTTVADLMNAVREYLDANPAQLDALGAWAVRDAMILRYPCD